MKYHSVFRIAGMLGTVLNTANGDSGRREVGGVVWYCSDDVPVELWC